MTKIKPLAFYLPQFHPVKENDEWWGKGFTEWTNVGKAKPLYKGHEQPICPADLGYYDLRVPEVRAAQARMAKEYGVYGFIYYHYWFGNGKQLLERIANEVLASKEPDFPFCFCWANETWSGIWHGLQNKILVEQVYPSDADLAAHFDYLLPFFKDKRYIKVDGKPLFMVYDPVDLDEKGQGYMDKFRKLAVDNGFPGLYFMASNKLADDLDYKTMGYDGKVSNAFQRAWIPHINRVPGIKERINIKLQTLLGKKVQKVRRQDARLVVDELKFVEANVATYPCVIANWDNTPRSGYRGVVLEHATPEIFALQLKKSIDFLNTQKDNEQFIFLKSWNEWAEGNVLEPDLSHGYTYLDVVKKAVCDK